MSLRPSEVQEAMVFPSILYVMSCLILTSEMVIATTSLSKPGCEDKCGNFTIPYPFGIGSDCSANSSFTVICSNSPENPPTPFLSFMNLEIVNISMYGAVIVNMPVLPLNCSQGPRVQSLPISLVGTPFSISAYYNALTVLGCKNSVWLRGNGTTVGGCMAMCDANSTDTSCNGVNCCQTSISSRVQEFQYTYQSVEAGNSSFCGYVFPADKIWLENESYRGYGGLVSDVQNPYDQEFRSTPLVLEWEFEFEGNISNGFCFAPDNVLLIDPLTRSNCAESNTACISLLDKYDDEITYSLYFTAYDYVSSSRYCSCSSAYEGNPYIGCRELDECSVSSINCEFPMVCKNVGGRFRCVDDSYQSRDTSYRHTKFRVIVKGISVFLGTAMCVLIFIAAAWKFGAAITEAFKAIKASRKFMFFKRNGGLLLEQHLAAFENGFDKTKLFTSTELAKATDDYNENRVLGRGGEGVVYKGMLEDGRIVAVKKSERVKQGGDVEDFINEVVIVSQINHRNVVKLLGCCLESEFPRLVYEFIPNGTLFSHIHHPHEDFPLFWEMRVRIAKEVAAALAYLHSAASVPIYHRDVKSTNILLDEKYRAKISDFGTSRSISLDQTHVTTRVVGTFGYLDPEYFQSSKFTEKSDVYSFGVVLVELLTGEKAISAVRVEEGRGLAMHFLISMDGGLLFDIVDARVLREGKREEIEAMAAIAKRCLHLNGKSRPTMKEVSRHLEGIQMEIQESDSSQSNIQSNDFDSDSFSSFSEMLHLKTIITSDSSDTEPHLLEEP